MKKQLIAVSLFSILTTVLIAGYKSASLPKAEAQTSGPTISNVTDNLSTYSNNQVPRYSKFELTFDITNTVATNLQFPYDESTPASLSAGIGISVDGLFSSDNWATTVIQPGFLYQDYEKTAVSNRDHLYPKGNPVWKIRFSPTILGTFQYKIRATDASGTKHYPENGNLSFNVVAPFPNNHGFIKVSDSDKRYFEFSDGTPFLGLGHNSSFNSTLDADSQFERYQPNGVNLLRAWLDGSAIAGSSWSHWTWFGGPWYGGYLPDPGYWINPEKNPKATKFYGTGGSSYDYTFDVIYNPSINSSRPCLFNGFSKPSVSVKPNTTYKIKVTALTDSITGPRNSANPNYGLTVKVADWPNADKNTCPDAISSSPALVPHINGDKEWKTVEGNFTTTASQRFLDYLFLVMDNAGSGSTAHVGEISIKEVLPDGSLGAEILVKSNGDMHYDFNQRESFMWDYILDKAAEKNIYLKLVLLEHNDRIWNFINADGTMSSDGGNNNFYAASNGGNNKVRRLHEYYYRYLAARWGYSTAVQSWEFNNEGDPFNGNHYNATDALGQFMRQWDRNHLSSTSFWHSYPATQFWGNPSYPNVDYADLHAYSSTGPLTPDSNDTTKIYLDYSNWVKGQQNIQKPLIRGETGIACPPNDQNSGECAGFQQDTQGVWLHKFLWSHLDNGFFYDLYWDLENIWNVNRSVNLYPLYKSFSNFLTNLPLNNGRFADIQATSSVSNLRVLGQKDTTNGRAYLWIDNKTHTWYNVVNNPSSITPISGTVSFDGMPAGNYNLSWFDTYTGAVTKTETLTVASNGLVNLTLSSPLSTDIAVKIESTNTPLEGDLSGDNRVDQTDIGLLFDNWGTIDESKNSKADVNNDGVVNGIDFTLVLKDWGRVQTE